MKTIRLLPRRRLVRGALFLLTAFYPLFFLFADFEPLNVMVEDLTFTRPEKWKWTPLPYNEAAALCFTIPTSNSSTVTDVYFYKINKNAQAIAKQWKMSFPEADEPGYSS